MLRSGTQEPTCGIISQEHTEARQRLLQALPIVAHSGGNAERKHVATRAIQPTCQADSHVPAPKSRNRWPRARPKPLASSILAGCFIRLGVTSGVIFVPGPKNLWMAPTLHVSP